MLTLKDLDNRVYSGKICSEFSYILKDDKGKPKFRANFARGQEENEWQSDSGCRNPLLLFLRGPPCSLFPAHERIIPQYSFSVSHLSTHGLHKYSNASTNQHYYFYYTE